MNPSWRRNYQRYKAYLLHTVEEYRHRKDVKQYLELLLSLTAIVIFATLALRPTLLTIADLFKQIDAKRDTIAQLDQKISNIETARQLYQAQENSIELLDEAVPNQPNPEQIVKQVEGLSSRHDFRLVTMSIGEADIAGNSQDTNDTPNALSYSINSQSNYEDLYRMLKDVERLRRPNVIESLSFTRDEIDQSIILVLNANASFFENIQPTQENER